MSTSASSNGDNDTSPSRVDLIRKLLKGIETGDPQAATVVHPDKYIQHNPQTKEGGEGLAALFARISKSHPRVNIVRAFGDGEYVFGHTEYDFATRRIGFEVFRFEGPFAVEHWDNIMPRASGDNPSGRSMVDGPTEATDLDATDVNRALVRDFCQDVLINDQSSAASTMDQFVSPALIQHNPHLKDGLEAFRDYHANTTNYQTLHRVLACGNFVLTVCEGYRSDKNSHDKKLHSAFYDLYRVGHGQIVEHWDTVETVPPESEWQNQNGKF